MDEGDKVLKNKESSSPKILIIGAGARGNAYARAICNSTNGKLLCVAEPILKKRKRFGEQFIWGKSRSDEGQEFESWQDFLVWEQVRRSKASDGEKVPEGVDAIFICILDELHKDAIVGLAPLGLHIMCEKPLATSLNDCISIYKSLLPNLPDSTPTKLFAIGHVLRYSPHNLLLRKLLLEDKVIGEIMSINHTEPVGWWHFAHSYVRGNWRKVSTSAPSLLTKSCHDLDLLLWILCSPPVADSSQQPHLPTMISSMGSVQYFNQTKKPTTAGSATNCLKCPAENKCKFSAKKIYLGDQHQGLQSGNRSWPINIILPDIEECITLGGYASGEAALIAKLAEDYDSSTPTYQISAKNWFGRCVFESDNDVCDNQVVLMSWDNEPQSSTNCDTKPPLANRGAKTAVFHMVAHTQKMCKRYSNIYGSDGEIYADSETITVQDFNNGTQKTYTPPKSGGGHGGGDEGLARQFIYAIDQVKNHGLSVDEAQRAYIKCTLEEVIRSHAIVFAAEEARLTRQVLDFPKWWRDKVQTNLLVDNRL
ncbi:unnamed protein product [Blumeria hordei]|uniref:Gfo/Idh/MocA-like oxidoreductase N-terminal domain-containing protein n=1 Tax=Blumeria hordei TaxID=2867405 RepID=A0A383UHN2_BLUHO|nr:unnamed protein product [Blumeria hordei]